MRMIVLSVDLPGGILMHSCTRKYFRRFPSQPGLHSLDGDLFLWTALPFENLSDECRDLGCDGPRRERLFWPFRKRMYEAARQEVFEERFVRELIAILAIAHEKRPSLHVDQP